jgi:hypothetical protein
MKRGVPPTARNARTGEFTPPGVTERARAKRAALAGAGAGTGKSLTYPSSLICYSV